MPPLFSPYFPKPPLSHLYSYSLHVMVLFVFLKFYFTESPLVFTKIRNVSESLLVTNESGEDHERPTGRSDPSEIHLDDISLSSGNLH